MMTDKLSKKWNLVNETFAKGLKSAREASGKSATECSHLLGITSSRLRSYENGKHSPSLPELEALSYIYKIPLQALLDPLLLPEYIHNPDTDQLKQLLEIRQQIIAARLQLAHEESGKSFKELSKETSLSASRLKKYENGELPVPLNDLKRIANVLNHEMDDFLDKESPIGAWQETQANMNAFKQLSEDIQNFALSEENQPYISFTNKVKEIGFDQFTQLSNSIQKILNAFHQDL